MSETDANTNASTAKPSLRANFLVPSTVEQVQLRAGFLFMVLSGLIFLYSFFQLIFREEIIASIPIEYTLYGIVGYVIEVYGDAGMKTFAAIILGLITGWIGLRLIGSVREDQSPVIRTEDRVLIEELIKTEKDKGVDQYIRLASLAGFSGNFTKLGLSGLPLATIGLTLIFVLLSLIVEKSYLEEAAQLTLGAFLGSFVQRAVEQQKPPK